MDLTHRFSVGTAVEETWAHFQDIGALAECFPGATVSSVEGDTFHGSCKVKLGPVALVYNGSGTFVAKDDDAHTFVVDAKGKDKRGNGTAGATVRLAMAPGESGGTDIEVVTDLAITGKPAQFGRGVMQDVSDKLLGQFVACLEQRLNADDQAPSTGSSDVQEPAPAVDPGPVPAAADAGSAGRHVRSVPPAARQDSLDLGAAVFPAVARGYWKQGLAGLAVVAIIIWLTRR